MQLKVVGRYRNGETAYEPGTIIHVKAEEAEFLFRDSPSSFEIHDDSVERAAAEAAAREDGWSMGRHALDVLTEHRDWKREVLRQETEEDD